MNQKILTIIDSKNRFKEINLDSFNKPYIRFGRNPEYADIVIDEPFISRVHGEFFLEVDRLSYKDVNKKNGTFIEQRSKRQHIVDNQQFVTLSDFAILRIGNPKNPSEVIVILVGNSHDSTDWKEKMILDGITVGRDTSNSIILKHPGVSRKHCEIRKRNNEYYLFCAQALNKVLLNGKPVKKEEKLNDKDVIHILDYTLIFSHGSIFYLDQVKGVSLSVNNITKVVGSRNKKKQILTDVSLNINANEFVAIIGGSGAGKTTLMNAISGFEPEFTGNVYCNGIDLIAQFDNFKDIIGYVPQQDIIYENLTLKKMLYYTAKLKMPKDTTRKEINQRISEVLKMVELDNHKNTVIRKLSGGQKKRASIAVELLADPKLFFLDEPTSGLDPGTERNLMNTLKRLAKEQNKTIIMVTHTTLNLHLCDKVIFMNPKGCLGFCGHVSDALSFFETNDLVNVYNILAQKPDYWANKFANISSNVTNRSAYEEVTTKKTKKNGLNQFTILTKRNMELLFRDFPRLIILLIQPVLIAFLLYIVADENIFKIYESTKSMLFSLVCSAIWIGLFNSIQEICKERVIVKREYMANLKLFNYVSSKMTVQVMLGGVQAFILSFLFLKLTSASLPGLFFGSFYLEVFLTIWLTIFTSSALGLLISAIVKSGDKAMTIAPFALIVQLLFSGILFKLEGLGNVISYFTISRWSVESLGSICNLNGMDLKMQSEFPMIEHEAEAFFEATKSHVLKDWFIILVMGILLLIICGNSLRNVAKDRR